MSLGPGLKKVVTGVILVLAVARLVGFGFEFAGEAIQTDFAAYYTAGQMVDAGLSPYRYVITPERIIWTSGDRYQHAQYIYPPLLAALFAPVAHNLSYLAAKYAWWFVDLLCLALGLSFSRRAMRLPFTPWAGAQLILAGFFHPLYAQLLRGQIDLVTMALIGFAFCLLARRRAEGWAGAALGVAALVKFHAGFIFPFLLIRRRFKAASGFAVAAGVMVALNFVVAGPANVQAYRAELPRISVYGGDGPPASRFTPEQDALVARLFPPEGGSIKDGFLFDFPGLNFVTNASFVELICCGAGFNLPRTTAMLAVWGFFVAAFWRLARRGYAVPVDRKGEYIYWFAVTNVALLAGPTTWAMNVVWLLPAIAILAHLWRLGERNTALEAALALLAAGLALAAMPDHVGFPGLFPRTLLRLSIYKYPLAEGLFILASLVYLRRRRLETAPAQTAG